MIYLTPMAGSYRIVLTNGTMNDTRALPTGALARI